MLFSLSKIFVSLSVILEYWFRVFSYFYIWCLSSMTLNGRLINLGVGSTFILEISSFDCCYFCWIQRGYSLFLCFSCTFDHVGSMKIHPYHLVSELKAPSFGWTSDPQTLCWNCCFSSFILLYFALNVLCCLFPLFLLKEH